MTWPNNIPPDLRKRINDVLGQRSFSAAEIWGEVRDWLDHHGVQVPEKLPEDVKVNRFIDN